MRSIFVEDSYLSIEHMHEHAPEGKNKVLTTSWLCPSYWHAMNLCAEVIHQRLWHLSELKKDDSFYNIEESPTKARVCRAFELSRWLAKQYPAKSNRWTPSRFVGGNGDGGSTEKTPRTRRRDARRAAHRTQKEASHSHHSEDFGNTDPSLWTSTQIASRFSHITGSEAKLSIDAEPSEIAKKVLLIEEIKLAFLNSVRAAGEYTSLLGTEAKTQYAAESQD
ncbi:hypothetical protein ACTXT7_010906 [Hymenolepis weldensis]